jgi:DNA-binding MarR family transcriptional regulator
MSDRGAADRVESGTVGPATDKTAPPVGTHRPPLPGGSVGFLLSQLGSAGSRGFQRELAPLGIEPRQFAMLRYVSAAEGQSQQALGAALGIPASRVVALVDDLEDRGLLERRQNPSDRRTYALFLTADGHELLAEALEVAGAHEAMVTSALTAAERAELHRLLEKVGGCLGIIAGVHPELVAPERD